MAAEAAYNTTINITAQPSIALSNEAMTDSGNHIIYTITNTAKRYIDLNTAVVIQKQTNGVGLFNTVTNYTFRRVGGIVTFASANNTGDVIRIQSGAYYVYATIGGAYSAEFSSKVQGLDVTEFNSNGYETWIGGLLGGTLKCSKWWLNTTRIQSFKNRDLLILSFQTASGRRFEGYVLGTECSLKGDIKSALEEELTFQLTNEFFNN